VGNDKEKHADPPEPSGDAAGAPGAHAEIPAMDFNLLVLSLNTSALIQLGDAPDPDGGDAPNLGMARHTIDTLAVLELKTRGNLSGQEERLLHQVLFDLRMRYTDKARR
jgi:hypothetical protein